MPADLHDTITQRLRAVGQRYTPGRRQLVDRLASAPRPVTIAELLDGGARVPQSSAYRNLAVLEQAGVVHRIVTSDDFARFELAEDLTEHHHHLICAVCGGVEDFTAPPGLERTLLRVAGEVAGAAGFTTPTHRLDLIGTCPSCA
ncbi:MAG: transcriptional repressor [Acidobacteria bacterium]|nr:transcriptional repressor [Acidobacteriota bacterium]